jgi:hypothetical protein
MPILKITKRKFTTKAVSKMVQTGRPKAMRGSAANWAVPANTKRLMLRACQIVKEDFPIAKPVTRAQVNIVTTDLDITRKPSSNASRSSCGHPQYGRWRCIVVGLGCFGMGTCIIRIGLACSTIKTMQGRLVLQCCSGSKRSD